MSTSVLRVPPQSAEAERAVLGALLLDHDRWDDVSGLVQADDFYGEKHRRIFEAMGTLRANRSPLDILTIGNVLTSRGQIEAVGGLSYLNELLDCVPTAANVMHYARRVRHLAVLRAVIGVAQEAAAAAYTVPDDAEDFIGKVTADLGRIDVDRQRGAATMAEVVEAVRADIRLAQERGQCVTSVTTGLSRLDDLIGGLHAGELVVMCGRPGTGKTVGMMTFAQGAARDTGAWSLVASLEMTAKALVQRAVSSASGVDGRDVRSGKLTPWQERHVMAALDSLAQDRVAFVSGAQTVSRVRAAARRQKSAGGLCAVFVDYLGLLVPEVRQERRDLDIGEMTRALKRMAQELDVPVVCLVQLNREVEKRDGGRPRMSDLRDSGRIEEDADVILGLHRDKVNAPRVLEVEILKGRNVGEGKVELAFDPARTAISNDNPLLSQPMPGDADYRGGRASGDYERGEM